MAFALLSVFEPPIVRRIHDMAMDLDEIEVKVSYYLRDWSNDPETFFLIVPRDATFHDLKIMLTYEDICNEWEISEMQIYVHQPWKLYYQDIDDDDEVLPWHTDYGEFYLKFIGEKRRKLELI